MGNLLDETSWQSLRMHSQETGQTAAPDLNWQSLNKSVCMAKFSIASVNLKVIFLPNSITCHDDHRLTLYKRDSGV